MSLSSLQSISLACVADERALWGRDYPDLARFIGGVDAPRGMFDLVDDVLDYVWDDLPSPARKMKFPGIVVTSNEDQLRISSMPALFPVQLMPMRDELLKRSLSERIGLFLQHPDVAFDTQYANAIFALCTRVEKLISDVIEADHAVSSHAGLDRIAWDNPDIADIVFRTDDEYVTDGHYGEYRHQHSSEDPTLTLSYTEGNLPSAVCTADNVAPYLQGHPEIDRRPVYLQQDHSATISAAQGEVALIPGSTWHGPAVSNVPQQRRILIVELFPTNTLRSLP